MILRFHYRLGFFSAMALAMMAIGCRQEEGIQTYSVSKPPDAVARSNPHAGMMPVDPKEKPVDATAVKQVDAPFDFAMPDGWKTGQPSAFRRASFFVGEGENRADIAVTEFSANAGPRITSFEANLNRWRGEVGQPPVEKSEADAAFEEFDLDDLAGHYVALDGPENKGPENKEPRRALRVAMIQHEGQIWFFKLSGQQKAVEKETVTFKKFLESVQFKAAKKSPPADE